MNLGFTILEIFGGLYVNSIAIISDAVHDLGDSLALGASWYLHKKSSQKPNRRFSFGYARFSLLGAVINSLVIIASSGFVIYEAIGRIIEPEHSNATGMILFALVGIAVNGYAAWRLSGGKSINERVVSWHLVEDVLGWVAILIVSIVLYFKDIPYLDPALSLLITVYILYNVFKRLKESTLIFLQQTPEEIDQQEIENALTRIERVSSVHQMHVWSLEGQKHVFSTHVRLSKIMTLKELAEVRSEIKEALKPFPFHHCTVETELEEETCFMSPGEDEEEIPGA